MTFLSTTNIKKNGMMPLTSQGEGEGAFNRSADGLHPQAPRQIKLALGFPAPVPVAAGGEPPRLAPRLRSLGSIRPRRVVFGSAPKTTSRKLFPAGNSRNSGWPKFGRDARTRLRDAGAPQAGFGVWA